MGSKKSKKKNKKNSNYKAKVVDKKVESSNKSEKKGDKNTNKVNKKKLREKAKELKKFPQYYKGYIYKPSMKRTSLYIDVVKADSRGKRAKYKVKGNQLVLVDTNMPMGMHREYQKVLDKNLAGILYNLKWYQLLWYRVTNVFKRKK